MDWDNGFLRHHIIMNGGAFGPVDFVGSISLMPNIIFTDYFGMPSSKAAG